MKIANRASCREVIGLRIGNERTQVFSGFHLRSSPDRQVPCFSYRSGRLNRSAVSLRKYCLPYPAVNSLWPTQARAHRCRAPGNFDSTFGEFPAETAMFTTTFKHLPALGLRVLAFLTISLAVIAAQTSGATNEKHFFWAAGQAPNPSSVSNDLIYH